MARHDFEIENQSGSAFRSDLNDLNESILTNLSGSGVPTDKRGYTTYIDTDDDIMKIRNSADSASATLFTDAGVFVPAKGGVSAPGYALSGDLNTGVDSTGADILDIIGGGVSGFRIDNPSTLNSSFHPLLVTLTAEPTITMYRTAFAANQEISVSFNHQDDASNQTTYAQITSILRDSANGTEDGDLVLKVMNAGTLSNGLIVESDQSLTTGTAATAITLTTGELRQAAIEQDSASNGQVLTWSTANSRWEPSSAGSGTISGSGTADTLPIFTASGTIGNSALSQATGTSRLETSSTFGVQVAAKTDARFPVYVKNSTADTFIEVESEGDAQWAGVVFTRERTTGAGVRSGFIRTQGDTGSNTGIIEIVASSSANPIGALVAGTPHIILNSTTGITVHLPSGDDFNVESETETNILVCDGANDRVGVGTGTPARTFDLVGDMQMLGLFGLGVRDIDTIATGAITVTSSYTAAAAESGTADNLDTITGGQEGDILILVADTGDTITVTEVGNISLSIATGTTVALTGRSRLLLQRGTTNWGEIAVALH